MPLSPAPFLSFCRRAHGAIERRLAVGIDFMRFRQRFRPYPGLVASPTPQTGRVLFVAGRGMNVGWAQIWAYLSLAFRSLSIEPCVVLYKKQRILRLYFTLAGARIFFLDALPHTSSRETYANRIATFKTVGDWESLTHHTMPIGQMLLSTYCRHHATGFIDPANPALHHFALEWLPGLCAAYDAAAALYQREHITHALFSETFIEEYGGFYFAALDAGLAVFKTSGTVRDNAIIVQRRTRENARLHHAALAPASWQKIRDLPDYPRIRAAVDTNFAERYSAKWHRSVRNHKNTRNMTRDEGRQFLGIAPHQKVAIIYSHILYDALFHYGDELFQDYATWLIETIRLAIQNPHLTWFVKLHPSNLWRGEFHSVLGGKYEEEKIIDRCVGTLPPHIRLIYADTPISPLGWYHIADYGLCVRGTAGLEMACLGKPVITAGTGRYEGNGFTIDPPTIEAYQRTLLHLHELPPLTAAETDLANRYTHGLFNLKPFTLSGLEVSLSFGKKSVAASDDVIYLPKSRPAKNTLPEDLKQFAAFIRDPSQADLLSDF